MADSNLPYVLEGEYRDVYEVAAIGSGLMETDMDCRDGYKLRIFFELVKVMTGIKSKKMFAINGCFY